MSEEVIDTVEVGTEEAVETVETEEAVVVEPPKTQIANLTDNLYRVSKNKGTIEFLTVGEALPSIMAGGVYNKQTAIETLNEGKVVFDDLYYFAVNFKSLEKWELKEKVLHGEGAEFVVVDDPFIDAEVTDIPAEQQAEDLPIDIGDTVQNVDNKNVGTVVMKGDKRVVQFEVKGKNKTTPLSDKWVKISLDTSLVKADEVHQGEVVVLAELEPLSEDERSKLAEYEQAYETASGVLRDALEKQPIEMGKALAPINAERLYRESHATFDAYVKDKWDIGAPHAYRLIQASNYLATAKDALQLAGLEDLSSRTAQTMMQKTNALNEYLGFDKNDFGVIKPVIDTTMQLLLDTIPEGKTLNQLHVTKFNEVLTDIVKHGTVEVEAGVQMSFEDAKEKGLLNEGLKQQILDGVNEVLHAKADSFKQSVQDAYDRQTAPVVGAGQTKATETWEGKTPSIKGIKCTEHGSTHIVAIGNGTMLTDCQCRWRMDAETDKLVCFEVEEKAIKVEAKSAKA